MIYDDFTIQVEASPGDGYRIRVLESPAGEGQAESIFDAELSELGRLVSEARDLSPPLEEGRDVNPMVIPGGSPEAISRDLRRRPGSLDQRLPYRELGDRLFRALFVGSVRALFDRSLGALAHQPDRGLRIKLKLASQDPRVARLESLPWEAMFHAEAEDFLCLDRRTPVVRYLDVPRPCPLLQAPKILRVLVAMSSPFDLAPLALDQELEKIQKVWGRRKEVEIVPLPKASVSGLRQELLSSRCHVVHFMGHGGFDPRTGQGQLYFESPIGKSEPITGSALATKLKDLGFLRLVFLNACKSGQTSNDANHRPFAGVANALVLGGLPAVVAMQRPISDRAAILFSTAFYRSVADGDPIDTAVTEGRQAVYSTEQHLAEWLTPMLYMRRADGRIFHRPRRSIPYRSLMGGGALTLLSMGFLVGPSVRQAWFPPTSRFEIHQSFNSTATGLDGMVTRVEILDHGRMRVHFEFRNTSTSPQTLGFDLGASYLADEEGNAYEILDADVGMTPGGVVVEHVAAGGRSQRWLEVSAPRSGARHFGVSLASHPGSPEFPLFELELPAYPEELSVPLRPKPSPKGAQRIELEVALGSVAKGLSASLSHIDRLATGALRWNLELFNRSTENQQVAIDYGRSYLVDDLGHRYPVSGYETGGDGHGIWSIRRALRSDRWIEFEGPQQAIASLRVVLFGAEGEEPLVDTEVPLEDQAELIQVDREKVPPPSLSPAERPAPERPIEPVTISADSGAEDPPVLETPAFEPYSLDDGEISLETSHQQVRGKLARIDQQANGRWRWHFEIFNESEADIEIGFDYDGTYISDERGTLYKLLSAEEGSSGIFQTLLAPGAKLDHWFEFSPPEQGAKRLVAVLANPENVGPRYRPLFKDF